MDDYISKEANYRTQLAKSLASANGPRRDQLTVLATACWFEQARRASKCSTYYAIERFFEPGAFGKNEEGDPYHRNKWAKYAVGLHQPSMAVVAKVDQKIPGVSKILRHPLWEILRDIDVACQKKDVWLGQLGVDVQSVVADEDAAIVLGAEKAVGPTSRQLQMLERRAGVDALACLSLLAAEAMRAGRGEAALQIASSLYRVLLIACILHPLDKLRNELFACMRERIFDRIHHGGFRLGLEYVDFPEEIYLLLQVKSALDRSGKKTNCKKSIIKAFVELLDGKYGYDVKFALNPPHVISEDVGDISASDREYSDRSIRLREWGLSALRSGRIEKFPPSFLL